MTRYRYRRRGRMSGKEGALAVVAGVVLAGVVGHGVVHDAAASARAAALSAPGVSSAGANVTIGQQMAAARGWAGSQWACLDWLWTRESNWNAYAANPTSSARGIPQDINGWNDYPPGDVPKQVTWGLGYIAGRYGTPCAAWAHETQQGWY
jgi:hypothetical protein